jgi:hypothetical protein
VKNESTMVVELPPDQEIECIRESRDPVEPALIRREVRYKDGMVATFIQDFQNTVFSINIRARRKPFWISSNRVLRAG